VSEPAELSYEKCYELLTRSVVGRVAMCTPAGPRITPVNYTVAGEAIIFRTTPYSVLGTYAWNTQLAFEIDHLDHENRLGWSVLATGRGSMVDDADELSAIRANWDPQPWAGGTRLLHIRLRWQELSGRRLSKQPGPGQGTGQHTGQRPGMDADGDAPARRPQ
jgi:uncharacterized protein